MLILCFIRVRLAKVEELGRDGDISGYIRMWIVVGGGLEGWRRTISGLDLLRIFRRDRKTGRIGVWRNDGLMFEAREGINL